MLYLKTLGFIISKMLFTPPALKKQRNFLAMVQLQSSKPYFYAYIFIYPSQLNSLCFTSFYMMSASQAVISSARQLGNLSLYPKH